MIVRVDVTAECVQKGRRCDGGACALALAFRRALPGATLVSVSSRGVVLRASKTDKAFHVPLPEAAASLVRTFDQGFTPAPLAFDVDIPDDEAPNLLRRRAWVTCP